jgi:hypothetical protein
MLFLPVNSYLHLLLINPSCSGEIQAPISAATALTRELHSLALTAIIWYAKIIISGLHQQLILSSEFSYIWVCF